MAAYRPDLAIMYVGWNDFIYYDPYRPSPTRSSAEFDSRLAFIKRFPSKFVALTSAAYDYFMLPDAGANKKSLVTHQKAVRLPQSAWTMQGSRSVESQTQIDGAQRYEIENQIYIRSYRSYMDPSKEFTFAVRLKGEGRLVLQANGYDAPWPYYNSCKFELANDWQVYSCPFRITDQAMDVQLRLINDVAGGSTIADVDESYVHETGVDISTIDRNDVVLSNISARGYGASATETYRFYVENIGRIKRAIKQANPKAHVVVSTLVGRWPTETDKVFKSDTNRLWIDQNSLDRYDMAAAIDRFDDVIRNFAHENSVPLLDPAKAMVDVDRASMMWDFAHFECSGYRLLARNMYSDLRKNLYPSWRKLKD